MRIVIVVEKRHVKSAVEVMQLVDRYSIGELSESQFLISLGYDVPESSLNPVREPYSDIIDIEYEVVEEDSRRLLSM